MVIATRPCEPWPSVLCCDDELPEDTPQEIIDQAATVATEILWALSGRRFGTCTVTMRPCRRNCAADMFPSMVMPWWGTYWPTAPTWWAWDSHCGNCGSKACSCTAMSKLRLPKRPVIEVVEVSVNGEVAPSGTYWRVDDFADLVRTDGERWPSCQNMNLELDQPDTFGVTWRFGKPVPASGLMAHGRLTCEIIKDCLSLDCELPSRLTQLSRQGVSMAFLDPQEYLDDGRTGIYMVDLFLKAFNPHNLTRRGRVRRADANTRRWTRTGT